MWRRCCGRSTQKSIRKSNRGGSQRSTIPSTPRWKRTPAPTPKVPTAHHPVKLTQEFPDSNSSDEDTSPKLLPDQRRTKFLPGKSAIINKIIAKHRKLEPVLKLLLAANDVPATISKESVIAEIDVYEESDYEELALLALRKLGLTESEHNLRTMRRKIEKRVEEFVKELMKGVKYTEKTSNWILI
jgi:hypothetical protein